MAERKERVEIQGDGQSQHKKQVVEYNPSTQEIIVTRVSRLIWLLSGILNALIAFRVILRLIAANPQNPFANLVYNATDPFLAPFQTLITNPTFGTSGSVLELTSIIAILVYVFASWALVALVNILFSDSGGTRRVQEVERKP